MIKNILRFIALLCLAAFAAAAYFLFGVFGHPSAPEEVKRFVIREGAGVNEISRGLFEAGMIGNRFIFETYVWLLRSEEKIQAGEYNFPSGLSVAELTRSLVTGSRLERERSVTFLEGWSVRDVARYLVKEGIAMSEDEVYAMTGKPGLFPSASVDFSAEYDFLSEKPKEANLEGYIYPDTYRIFKNADVESVLRRMLDNFEVKVTSELRAEIARQGKTLRDVLILASIVEREVRGAEDRRMVADIFWRRLDAGMALQADSTVNYITGGTNPAVTLDELAINSPYNTYKYQGLPPGPISNPSIEAIEAAVHPQANDFWYFLTTLDDGRVIYAKTNEEQNKNKYKYLK